MKTPRLPNADPLSSGLIALKFDRAHRRWRLIALLALGMIGVWVFNQNGRSTGDHIAIVQVTGFINSTLTQQQRLHHIATADKAKAVIVYIDSSGGSVTGGMDLFAGLRAIAAHKPVVVVMGTTAASAGYLAALGADHIIANEASITGSIGVLMPLVDATELAAKLGIKSQEITSGKLKAVTSPLYQRSITDNAYLQNTVNDLNALFLAKVTERRHITPQTLRLVSDARVLSGHKALSLGLVDALGGYSQALIWLQNKGVDLTLPEIDYSLDEEAPWYQRALEGALIWPQDHLSQWFLGR